MTKAEAASYGYFIKNGRNPDIDKTMYQLMESDMADALFAYNDETEYVRFEMYSIAGL